MTSADALAPVGPHPAPKKRAPRMRQIGPARKTGQPSKLRPAIRAVLDRTKAALGGEHAAREHADAPKATASHPPGSVVKFTEEARKFHGWRQREMTVVACTCPLCTDGRCVAVDEPWKYDAGQRQHFAVSKLRRAEGKSTPDDDLDTP